MPDHVHVVAYGTSLSSDFPTFVNHFKQTTGYACARRSGHRLWQPGFYDRILCDDESTEAVARYVLENPIRAGLTRALGEYPFAGSDLYDVEGVTALWQDQRWQP
jgi:hypothetical protein